MAQEKKPITQINRQDLHLEGEIGYGGFGSVYLATWNQHKVAAKRLNQHRGKLEMEIMSILNHPNIVKLFGVVDEKYDFFLVMELCDGGSLRDYLDQQNGEQLPTEQFFDLAKQAAKSIKYLKEMGLIHKDIKSPNYLLTNGMILKLCDFGSAKNLTITISNASSTASFAWMPPELLKDEKLSPTYDIYCYGVVVWELWTTKRPFDGCVPVHIIWRVCHYNEKPPIPPNCPEPIANLMRNCWETIRNMRPSIDNILIKLSSCEQEVTREVQKQLITGPWMLDYKFGLLGPGKLTDPRGVAVGRKVTVTDCEEEQVKLYGIDGDYMASLDTRQHLESAEESDPWLRSQMESKPWNVAVSTDGKYQVTDSTDYVLVYDAEGQYRSRWAAVCPEDKPSDQEPSKLQGLAIDTQGEVFVGEVVRRYISIHRPDGDHVRSIKIHIRPHFLCVTSHDAIVISDRIDNIVQIIDKSGQVLHTLKPKSTVVRYWQPKGVCCHGNMIFVCNYAMPEHGICCFSLSGEYLGSIAIGQWPMDIAYVKESKSFVVTHRNEGRVMVYSCRSSFDQY